jgi:hypothetical protein
VSTTKGVQWCNRLHVYRLVEFYMTQPFRVLNRQDNIHEMRPLTEEEALRETNKTFLCCVSQSGKPNFRQKVVPQFKRQQVYENGACGRLVDPTDEIRFIPGNVKKLVQTYMDRSLTSDQAWKEADKTIMLSLPQKYNIPGKPLAFVVAQQQDYEDKNLGRVICLKEGRFVPTWN